jgi:hypothetical protein
MLPLSRSGRVRAPWPPSSCARHLQPSSRPVTGMTSDRLGSARFSAAFTAFHPVAFTSRFPSALKASRHCFRSLRVGVARPRPRYARYPSPSRRESTPWPPTIQRQDPTATPLRLLVGAFRPSPADFPRGVSRFPSPGLQPHGSQGHVGQVTISGIVTYRMLRSAYNPC